MSVDNVSVENKVIGVFTKQEKAEKVAKELQDMSLGKDVKHKLKIVVMEVDNETN